MSPFVVCSKLLAVPGKFNLVRGCGLYALAQAATPLAQAAAPNSHQAVVQASAPQPSSEHAVAIFIAEIAVMLLVGRLLGELMQRVGQPAVMGQLIAGVVLGPSVLGVLWPHGYLQLFPDDAAQKKMIDAISQLGILMLLLLTGMETDLSLVNRMRRTAFFASLSGIIFPFTCGARSCDWRRVCFWRRRSRSLR